MRLRPFPIARLCRSEISLALMEGALEKGLVACEVMKWKHGPTPVARLPAHLLTPKRREYVRNSSRVMGSPLAWGGCLLVLGALFKLAIQRWSA